MGGDKLFLVKLGGSLITDKRKPYTPRIDVIRRLAREIKNAVDENDVKLILGHGGGSFPHVSAARYETHKGFIHENSMYGMVVVHNDAMKLNSIIINELISVGVNAFSIQSSSISITENSVIKEMYVKPIKVLLEYSVIPVVYGDVGIDLKQGCCIMSTEEIFRYLALNLLEKYEPFIIMCEEVEGIYTKDPFKYPDARLIENISRKNIEEVRRYLTESYGIDVTGGMKQKVEVLFELAKNNIESLIVNGLNEKNLGNALRGRYVRGTYIKY